MRISTAEAQIPTIENVKVTGNTIRADLSDGRTIVVPIAWFPRLAHGTPKERGNWRLVGKGFGIHWEDLDEDISVENLLLGKASGESQSSFRRWMESRRLA
jgi:Protein of unknown function (DUF2442)